MTKQAIDDKLRKYFDDNFITLWWSLKLPGLGYETPNNVWERNPEEVLDYVNTYEVD